MNTNAAERRAVVLRIEQNQLTDLIAEVAMLSGYWQGVAHVCARTGCRMCRDIAGSETEAAA